MSSSIFDRLRHQLDATPFRREATADEQHLDQLLRRSEVFVSTNVTEYYFAGTDQEFWHLDRDFPNLAPLYNSFFIETKHPTHIRSASHGTVRWEDHPDIDAPAGILTGKRPCRWGAWFLNVSTDSPVFQEMMDSYKLSNVWLYYITIFVQLGEDEPISPAWYFVLAVDKETGLAVKNDKPLHPGMDSYSLVSEPLGIYKRSCERLMAEGAGPITAFCPDLDRNVVVTPEGAYSTEAIGLLKPLLLAISFAHCKNVVRTTVHASPKLNKKRISRNLPPTYKFHTLEIKMMRQIIDQAARQFRGLHGGSGITMALHKVRGHFKTYTSANPLLGHAVGTWFWAPNTRGSKKRGVVVKDYAIGGKDE